MSVVTLAERGATKTLADLKSTGLVAVAGLNKRDIFIDGRECQEYDLPYEGPEGPEITFFNKGVSYTIIIQHDIYAKSEYAKAFNNLRDSIMFK